MYNQFNGFCYPSLTDAVTADISGPVIPVHQGLATPISFVADTSTTATVTYAYRDLTLNTLVSYTLQRQYPECLALGNTNNNSGLTVGDALETSWLVVVCWLAAYLFKVSRTGVRGY